VINVGMLARTRRMYFRDGLPIREIAWRTGLSRNIVTPLAASAGEPYYPEHRVPALQSGQ